MKQIQISTIAILVALGMFVGFFIGIQVKNAAAQISPAAPDDIRGIRLATEEISRNTKKIAECKK